MKTKPIQDKATARPWRWQITARGEFEIVGANNQRVLLIGDDRRLIPMREDRELFLQSVNEHALLVAVAEAAGEVAARNVGNGRESAPNGYAIALHKLNSALAALAAVRKAGGQ